MSRARRRNRGFSTAETLVGAALSLIALAALASFFQAQQKAHATQSVYADSQTVTRTVMDLMTRELRMACFDPTGTALTTASPPNCPGNKQGLVKGTPNKLRFKQDLTGDGLLNAAGEDVTYDVAGSQIRRQDGATSPVTIVDNVPAGGLLFRYFDNSNPPNELIPATGLPPELSPAQLDCVSKVQVTVRSNLPNPNKRITTPITSVAESEVAIRNRSLVNF